MAEETKQINVSGGTFIEGGVKVEHGDFVAGDKIVHNTTQGMSKEEFLQLLQTLKQDLAASALPADELESVNSDIQAVEEQLKKDQPKKAIVSGKLNGINTTLDNAMKVINTVEKGDEVFNKIMTTVKTLMTVIGTASFFL